MFEDSFFFALIVCVVGVLAIFWVLSYHRRARRAMMAWADRNAFRIASAHLCSFWGGPFWYQTGRGHVVYRVSVIDHAQRRRDGWVHCPPLSDAINERWDPQV